MTHVGVGSGGPIVSVGNGGVKATWVNIASRYCLSWVSFVARAASTGESGVGVGVVETGVSAMAATLGGFDVGSWPLEAQAVSTKGVSKTDANLPTCLDWCLNGLFFIQ